MREPTTVKGNPPTPRVAQTASLVALATIASKLVGLVRVMVIARLVGTGVIADAYNSAYLFTGNFFVLLGGLNGPVDSAALAVLRGTNEPDAVLRSILSATLKKFGMLTIVGYLLTPIVIPIAASIYGHDKIDFTEQLFAQLFIMLPTIVIGATLGVLYGLARLDNKVVLPSLAPAIASIVLLLTLWIGTTSGVDWGVSLAAGTLIGALAQMLLQAPMLAGLRRALQAPLTQAALEAAETYRKNVGPALLSTSIGQLTVYVDYVFSLGISTGAWTAVSYSSLLVQLPLGILNTSLLIPIFPRFAQAAAEKKMDVLQADLHMCLRFLWFVTLPLIALFLALAEPMITILFEGGNFDRQSVRLVTTALIFLTPQMFFYLGRELFTRALWAFNDTRTPFKCALLVLVVKAILDALFIFVLKLEVAGISLATTLVSAMSFIVLGYSLRLHTPLGLAKIVPTLAKVFSASVAAYFVTNHTFHTNTNFQLLNTLLPEKLRLILLVTASGFWGVAVYVIICLLLRVNEIGLISDYAGDVISKFTFSIKPPPRLMRFPRLARISQLPSRVAFLFKQMWHPSAPKRAIDESTVKIIAAFLRPAESVMVIGIEQLRPDNRAFYGIFIWLGILPACILWLFVTKFFKFEIVMLLPIPMLISLQVLISSLNRKRTRQKKICIALTDQRILKAEGNVVKEIGQRSQIKRYETSRDRMVIEMHNGASINLLIATGLPTYRHFKN